MRTSWPITRSGRREAGLPALCGATPKALASADKVIEAEFEFPYLAHAPMEPLNCVVELSAGGCEIWAGSQFQTVEQGAAAAYPGHQAGTGEDQYALCRRLVRPARNTER